MTDPAVGMLETMAIEAGTKPAPEPCPAPLESRLGEPTGRGAAFDARIHDRRRLSISGLDVIPLSRRPFRFAPSSAWWRAIA